jgi:flagellum-specific peptidoglycan hydrolase FlgJ
MVKSVERFRSYGSYAESMQDFARLVRRNPRYANAVTDATNADAYAQGMQKAGYATDPDYATKLARAIRMVARHGIGASDSAGAVQVVARPADSAASGRTPADKA